MPHNMACHFGAFRSDVTTPMAEPLPVSPGSMILDLSRMQAIEANEELAYAVVEPGVTYVTLYKFIQDKQI